MKNIFIDFFGFVLIAFVIYIAFGIFAADINCFNWQKEYRGIYAFLFACIFIIAFAEFVKNFKR